MRPDIDFSLIRLHRNSQASAFEELCCQLAGDEQLQPVCTSFNRKGLGADGGLECFAVLSDGTETGWQVKYYWEMGSALSSLNESLSTALAKHPKMTRFIACLPFDLSDSRKPGVTTALDRWNTWKGDRIIQAKASGRKLEIERWDAYEIKRRLTASAMAAGRIAYWFDQTLLTKEWFRNNFERARLALGKRYSPESHIDLPIRRVIEATVLEPRLFSELAAFSETIEKKLAYTDLSDPVAVSGVVRFMDPSVSMEGRSAALIDRETFLSFLEKEKCVVVWALSGEKNVYGKGVGSGFGGRWTFTRVFHSQGTEIVALERYQTFEAPSTGQLDELRAVEEEVAVGSNDSVSWD